MAKSESSQDASQEAMSKSDVQDTAAETAAQVVEDAIKKMQDVEEGLPHVQHTAWEDFKAWVRREISLATQGHSEETRVANNP